MNTVKRIVFMKSQFSEIKELVENLDSKSVVEKLNELLSDPNCCYKKDELYYTLGNVYRKQGDFQMALNNYLEAISINPESPAVHAREMLMDILNFYNKDMYNQ